MDDDVKDSVSQPRIRKTDAPSLEGIAYHAKLFADRGGPENVRRVNDFLSNPIDVKGYIEEGWKKALEPKVIDAAIEGGSIGVIKR